jgi:hypothetical protein
MPAPYLICVSFICVFYYLPLGRCPRRCPRKGRLGGGGGGGGGIALPCHAPARGNTRRDRAPCYSLCGTADAGIVRQVTLRRGCAESDRPGAAAAGEMVVVTGCHSARSTREAMRSLIILAIYAGFGAAVAIPPPPVRLSPAAAPATTYHTAKQHCLRQNLAACARVPAKCHDAVAHPKAGRGGDWGSRAHDDHMIDHACFRHRRCYDRCRWGSLPLPLPVPPSSQCHPHCGSVRVDHLEPVPP